MGSLSSDMEETSVHQSIHGRPPRTRSLKLVGPGRTLNPEPISGPHAELLHVNTFVCFHLSSSSFPPPVLKSGPGFKFRCKRKSWTCGCDLGHDPDPALGREEWRDESASNFISPL